MWHRGTLVTLGFPTQWSASSVSCDIQGCQYEGGHVDKTGTVVCCFPPLLDYLVTLTHSRAGLAVPPLVLPHKSCAQLYYYCDFKFSFITLPLEQYENLYYQWRKVRSLQRFNMWHFLCVTVTLYVVCCLPSPLPCVSSLADLSFTCSHRNQFPFYHFNCVLHKLFHLYRHF